MTSEKRQLELIRDSLYSQRAEDEAKLLFLKEVYEQVRGAWRPTAPNGGRLAELPDCVRSGTCIDPDDLRLSYNALRVLAARYMTRDETGRWMETPSMVFRRVAEGLARFGVDAEKLYRAMVEGRFLPNSPTLFNMYCDGAVGTLSACYVTPVGDSMREIMEATVVQALTFKWGGGQGFSFSELRPRGDVVRGTSGVASGPVSFMRLFDVVTEVVKQGGKRRGANMGILHAWHPDIYNPGFDPWAALYNMLPPQVRELLERSLSELRRARRAGVDVDESLLEVLERLVESGRRRPWVTVEDAGFVQAKEPPLQDANLTNFNISVAANDAFMEAVFEDREWWMVNPRFSAENGVYRLHYTVSRATNPDAPGVRAAEALGGGNPYVNIFEDVYSEALSRARRELERHGFDPRSRNHVAWVYPARRLFEEIVEAAWSSGDPGIIYIDNHNKWIETPWLGFVYATNPCGEEPLYPFESCNLGSINLEKYVVCEGSRCRLDLHRLYEDVRLAVQALDAVIDANRHPDERQTVVNRFTRKVGLGFMGLASTLARLGIPYDSDEAVAFTLIVAAAIEAYAWLRSWELGAEKGHAPAFECKRFDWSRLECLERWEPEDSLRWFTPGLRKAGMVARVEDGWLKLRYHRVRVDEWVRSRLGSAASRVESDGTVRLVPWEAVKRVWRRYFADADIEALARDAIAALEMSERDAEAFTTDPVYLAALAVVYPSDAWEAILAHGMRLGARAPRNTAVTTIAPTGTISILAGASSSGIEPFFALVYKRVVTVGEFLEVVKPFRDELLDLARRSGATREHLEAVYTSVLEHGGSLRVALRSGLEERLVELGAPPEFTSGLHSLAARYPVATDIDPMWHILVQAAAQLYVDQSISKTVNLPPHAPRDEAAKTFLLAWLTGVKGVTIYREGSKATSVIQTRRANRMRLQTPKRLKQEQQGPCEKCTL